MSKFYGQVFGSASTSASRRGSDSIRVSAQSYDGSVITYLSYLNGKLMVSIETSNTTDYRGRTLFYGTFEEFKAKLGAE